MVVLLHGYGSNGADLMGLVPYWRASLPDTVFMAPNAPEICPGAPGGYQWWSLTDLGRESRAAGVRQAAPPTPLVRRMVGGQPFARPLKHLAHVALIIGGQSRPQSPVQMFRTLKPEPDCGLVTV
jgi:hypothetical protein